MRRIIAVLTCCAGLAVAQSGSQLVSRAPERARYEIVFLKGPGSLRLDRALGRVSRLVSNRDQPAKWQEMAIPERSPASPNEERYQMVVLPDNALPLLLDTTTGRTWQLAYNATTNAYAWGLVTEPGDQ
jgi:hypothetical protein